MKHEDIDVPISLGEIKRHFCLYITVKQYRCHIPYAHSSTDIAHCYFFSIADPLYKSLLASLLTAPNGQHNKSLPDNPETGWVKASSGRTLCLWYYGGLKYISGLVTTFLTAITVIRHEKNIVDNSLKNASTKHWSVGFGVTDL